MNRQRLQKASTFLREVVSKYAPGKFYMRHWVKPGYSPPAKLDGSCNTAACAVGWLAVRFHDEGLWIERSNRMTAYVPTYKDASNWHAVCSFFGLDPEEAVALFDADQYEDPRNVTALDVADRIDALLGPDDGVQA